MEINVTKEKRKAEEVLIDVTPAKKKKSSGTTKKEPSTPVTPPAEDLTPKKELQSCVDGLSVQEERKLFAELRKLHFGVDEETMLVPGLRVYDFNFRYVLGNRKKRQQSDPLTAPTTS